jgi:hypothetical protein
LSITLSETWVSRDCLLASTGGIIPKNLAANSFLQLIDASSELLSRASKYGRTDSISIINWRVRIASRLKMPLRRKGKFNEVLSYIVFTTFET